MKLKEFKKIINQIPESMNDAEVILQKDAEGNGYSPVEGIDDNSIYIPDTTWMGVAYRTPDECCLEEDEWEAMKKNPKYQAIILWPTN